ncbi:hypothetical protein [Streptomyces sp. NPDC048410]|uniref:hypothetical protein n=1 Tax=Streptomyces sp. NPDC048410 TaxID=3365545 RepID=UPI003715DCDD
MRELVEHFGVTFVLSSPAGTRRTEPLERDIVSGPAPLFKELRRVRYERRSGPDVTLASIAAEAAERDQALVLVNGTKDASQVRRILLGTNCDEDPGVLHLSTRMTGGHSRETIKASKQRLEEGLDSLLVSTSLIEADVNLGFPCGYRARSTPSPNSRPPDGSTARASVPRGTAS